MMKTGKSPGKDGIKAELLQKDGENMVSLIHFIFQQVWEKGLVP